MFSLASKVFPHAVLVVTVSVFLLLAPTVGASATSPTPPRVTRVAATSGPSTGGTRVTVKGTNLSHVTAVSFGGVRGTALHVALSHKTLLVTAPVHVAGAVDIRVTTTSGTSAKGSKDVFTFRTYAALSAGGDDTCMIDGPAVYCWGTNGARQLGNAAIYQESWSLPVRVEGLTGHVVALAVGGTHTCALIADGTVRCWGDNRFGELGGEVSALPDVPVKVTGLRHVVAISTSADDSCALVADGTVWCWGYNRYGQIGNGSTKDAFEPVQVSHMTHAIQISVGVQFACALRSDATVSCWGSNFGGELGNGSTADAHAPVAVVGLTHVTQVSAALQHSCALLSGGAIRCWGVNDNGQLGNGTTIDSRKPVTVKGLTRASVVKAHGGGTCALKHGHAFCWGYNGEGEVGDGTVITPRQTPREVLGLPSNEAISSGDGQSCVTTTSGSLFCWGLNKYGAVGDGTYTDRPTRVRVR
jgi:alpha-tubulin suppressor-like RCC1 family protein